jgi:hypothetical protein
LGYVHGQDLFEARPEYFLGIAQVADDFLGRPILGIGSAGEVGVAPALHGGAQLVDGAGEALHALLARLLGVLFHRRHQGLPSMFTITLVWHRPRGSREVQFPRR